ncbi:aminoglycoside 6-adenylyltransferase [Planococcus shenhongbingii]|uniref:Aminoglycoside 6-adenylyltransferase n=1 Tax=Planococcus shenhongbingii TaxID=3058398 RepID=A0ABT8N853_9BACL|nr:aminoglycoside 6-adenylyltransferase [Planococcus sp. N017]MDN7243908.1 aminoglycoside 6-adenylyltransferase [Planococcus sp. N017]
MRTEEDILGLILSKAIESGNIRLVEMNGSRVDSQAKKDPFQDYDIVYYVEDMQPFINNHSWIDYFGERIMMQMPDQMVIPPADKTRKSFSYLMLFTDGNRIDLTLTSVTLAEGCLKTKEPRKILLDKDNRIKPAAPTTENPYQISKPDQKAFYDCSNEFWWVSTYIAKALWREELTLAKSIMEGPVRNMLLTMLNWHVGIQTNFTVSTGKGGKNIEQYVESDVWNKLVLTYPDGNYKNIWEALFNMCNLFDELSINIGQELNIDLPDYRKNVLNYLKHIEKLPKNSEHIYR